VSLGVREVGVPAVAPAATLAVVVLSCAAITVLDLAGTVFAKEWAIRRAWPSRRPRTRRGGCASRAAAGGGGGCTAVDEAEQCQVGLLAGAEAGAVDQLDLQGGDVDDLTDWSIAR